MDADVAKQLRAEFPPKLIGKLPKAGVMLEFVGHAAVTDRLLQVDPAWTWEPMGRNPDGTPAFDDKGGLWIWLSVAGVRRPGYGEPGRIGPKEAIGDAIRNAAMRFGVALDLWAKEDLHAAESDVSTPRPARRSNPAPVEPNPPAAPRAGATQDEHTLSTVDLKLPPEARKVITAAQVRKMWTMARGYKLSDEQVHQILVDVALVDSSKLIPRAKFEAVLGEIELTGKGVTA